MSSPARPEERPGDAGSGVARGDASTGAAPGPLLPPELLRDAQRVAVDLLVFAPIGFAKRARSLLPDLIREGRTTAASARTIGKFVTPIARQQGTKLVKAKVAELTRSTAPSRSPRPVPAPVPPSSSPPAASTPEPVPAGTSKAKAKAARKSPPRPAKSSVAGSSASREPVSREPFGGYDHLGSAAVVARLGELSRTERAAVRAYETANRNRRTILGRLDQLDSSR